jgi:hypothetical protein
MWFILTRIEIVQWEIWRWERIAAPGVAALVSDLRKYGQKFPISAWQQPLSFFFLLLIGGL